MPKNEQSTNKYKHKLLFIDVRPCIVNHLEYKTANIRTITD